MTYLICLATEALVLYATQIKSWVPDFIFLELEPGASLNMLTIILEPHIDWERGRERSQAMSLTNADHSNIDINHVCHA